MNMKRWGIVSAVGFGTMLLSNFVLQVGLPRILARGLVIAGTVVFFCGMIGIIAYSIKHPPLRCPACGTGLNYRYQRQPGIEDSRFGIGLGMVLIRSAAANHGGTVLIDRPEGGGTRITMTMAIRQNTALLKSPVIPPVMDNSREILTELSESLPWEFYQK